MSASANIARHLASHAALHPGQAALKIPRGSSGDRIDYLTLSYAELAAEVAAHRARLAAAGLRPGDRTLVMVRQGLPLIAVVFALFELGALPIVIDPGMGRKNFLRCVAQARPGALVGIPTARLASWWFREAFRSVRIRVGVSGSTTARLTAPGATRPAGDPGALPRRADDPAAILFTSGSTGAPKGVCYAHGHFDAQVRMIREAYHIEPGEVDLPLLPLFALFAPALGMTVVVPELDPSRPAQADPARLVRAILQEKVTTSFGSPTLWGNITAYCHRQRITLPSLRRVLCAGAPVPPWLWPALAEVMPRGVPHSPYGATEALPVSTVSGPEITGGAADETLAGAGVCVGRILSPNTVRIVAPVDGPIRDAGALRELPAGEIGEIIVAGPAVTLAYDDLPEATAAAKIRVSATALAQADARRAGSDLTLADPATPPPAASLSQELADTPIPPTTPSRPGATEASPGGSANSRPQVAPSRAAAAADRDGLLTFHRMGDLGYFDATGRLWFVGRKAEAVHTPRGPLYPAQVEPLFDGHRDVRRCALIGVGARGRQKPCIVVELAKAADVESSEACRRLARELRVIALAHVHTAAIKTFYFRASLPVDVRHNAKIHRLSLAAWAADGAVGFESDPKR